MSLSQSVALLRVPSFTPVALSILLVILAEAIGGSYMVLLAVERVGMTPFELSLFLTLSAAAGMAISTLLGSRHDRRPALWPVLVSLAAKGVGLGLCAVVSDPWALIVIGFVLLSLGTAAFSLLFATAKGYLDVAGGDVPASGMAALRMTSSLGWAIGPAIGAGLVWLWGFTGVYLGAAALAAVAILAVIAGRITPLAAPATPPRITRAVLAATAPAMLGLLAFYTAMFMGSNALSVVVIRELGTETDVGLLYSLCAAIEVVVMGTFVVRPRLSHSRPVLLVGYLLFAVYFLALLLLPTLPVSYLAQVLRAAAIGIVSVVGMAILQQMLPGRAGVAAALFGNAMGGAALLSGLGTGLIAGAWGYTALFGVCAALALLSALAGLARPATVPAG